MTSIHRDPIPVAGQQAWSKTRALLAGAALLLALGVALTIWSFRQIEVAAQQRQHTHAVIERADDLLAKLRDAETGQRGYVTTGDESFLAPYLAVHDSINGSLAQLRQLALVNQAGHHLNTRHLQDLQEVAHQQLQLSRAALQVSEEKFGITFNPTRLATA